MSPSGSRQTSNGSTNQQSQERSTGTSGAGDSWWNTMPRRSGGSSSSRDSSRERPRRRSAAPADGGWIDSSSDEAEASSENENDDVPLSKLHPAASAAQQQRLVDAVRRREARRAERERKLRTSKSQLLERERDRMIKQRDQRDIQREGTTRRSRNQAEWSGEGGVPADVLAGRLERVAVSASATGGSSSQRVGPAPALTRTHTSASQHGRPARSTGDSAATPATPGTAGASLSASLSRTPTAGASAHSSLSTQSGGGRLSSSTSRVPASTGWPALGRSATTSSRHRTSSNVRDEATREAAPPVPRRGLPVRCTILTAAGTRPLSVEYTPDTTAREVLQRAREAASLVDGASGSSLGWAVWERFGELGLERQVREYEAIAAVVRGWDAQRTDNGLFVREGHTANLTHERAVPSSAPFVGGWVQLETKLGKWSKRWMETRGGQIFLSKNEKGKEEIQVNTIFSDIYVPSGTYAAPQRYVFALKRRE
jgi:hypothetical protein